MDIQALLKGFSEIRKLNSGNLTIKQMLDKLSNYDDQEKVTFSNGMYFDGGYGSYRGYYEDLYLGYDEENQGLNTVEKIKKALKMALADGVMQGYKGGDFTIEEDTNVWFSTYGSSGDDMIIDVQKVNGEIFIITKEDE